MSYSRAVVHGAVMQVMQWRGTLSIAAQTSAARGKTPSPRYHIFSVEDDDDRAGEVMAPKRLTFEACS